MQWGYGRLEGYWYRGPTWKFIGSIYVEKFALWSDIDLKYSPTDLHKPYIISEQKTHLSYLFFKIHSTKVSCNCFTPAKWYFDQKKYRNELKL